MRPLQSEKDTDYRYEQKQFNRYSNNKVLLNSTSRGIIPDEKITIERKYWRGKITNFLNQLNGENDLSLKVGEDEKSNEGHRFNIVGISDCHASLLVNIQNRVKKTFRYCTMEYEIPQEVTWRFQKGPNTYILVPDKAQTFIDSRGFLFHKIREKIWDKNVCLFIISIFFLALFIFLLVKHWWGYSNPWKVFLLK